MGGAADDTNNRLLGYPYGATSQPTVRAAHPHQPDHRPPLTTTKNVNQNKTHLNTQKLTPTPNQHNPFACLGFLLGLCCRCLCGCGCVCCGGGLCPRTPPPLPSGLGWSLRRLARSSLRSPFACSLWQALRLWLGLRFAQVFVRLRR